jgi:folate-binding protein YgfZ
MPQEHDACVFFDLSQHGKVELAGPDARLFLHNLCTNDVKNLPVGAGCEAFLTSAKARVLAHVLVGHYAQDDGAVLWLDTIAGPAEALLAHLNRYLISEQVELADRTSELALFRLCGPAAVSTLQSLLEQSVADLAPSSNRRVAWPKIGACHVRAQTLLGNPGFDVLCARAHANAVLKQLQGAGARLAEAQTYEMLRIEAGLPHYGRDIDENRFVVEVNRPQAISYTKGCYLGQEPIVMARDRGQVNRLLLGVKAAASTELPFDAKLFHGETEVGQVKSPVWSPRLQESIALAYVRRGHQEPGTKLEMEPLGSGLEVAVTSLPFVP